MATRFQFSPFLHACRALRDGREGVGELYEHLRHLLLLSSLVLDVRSELQLDAFGQAKICERRRRLC